MTRAFLPARGAILPLATLLVLLVLAVPFAGRTQAPRRSSSAPAQPPARELYAGDEACRSCHAEDFKTYAATAHHLTSQLPGPTSIAGSFADDANTSRPRTPRCTSP